MINTAKNGHPNTILIKHCFVYRTDRSQDRAADSNAQYHRCCEEEDIQSIKKLGVAQQELEVIGEEVLKVGVAGLVNVG